MQQTVGFVGLGNMGKGMARNIRQAGFPLVVYDVQPEPVAELVQTGARAVETLVDLGTAVDTVVIMVRDLPQIQAILWGPEGLAAALKPGATVIVSSTISPSQARELAQTLTEHGLIYVDAPVSGGKARADEGTLTIMVGADPDVFAAQRPLLETMCQSLYHCGPVGAGQAAKMCNQLMAGVTLAASAECLALAAAAGVDRRLIFDIVTHSTGDCWMLRNRAIQMIEGGRTNSRLDFFLKDLGIVLDSAEELHLPLLVAAAARQWYLIGVASGYGAEDDVALVWPMEQFTGAKVKAE
jgi:putative dehydrogenase